MNKSLISIILPVYNGERFLKQAIDSILRQSYEKFELIIINDGSTDKTEDIILSYSDRRIVYIKNETNLKLIRTLNKGLDLAKGEYIARMDADDIALPNRLEKEMKFMLSHPDIDVVSVYATDIDMQNRFLCHSSYFTCTQNNSCRFVSILEPPILHPGVLAKSIVLKKYRYSKNESAQHIEDYELWSRMLSQGCKFGVVPEFLMNYRNNSSSVGHVYSEVQLNNHIRLLIKNVEKDLGIHLNDGEVKTIVNRLASSTDEISSAFDILDKLSDKFVSITELSCLEAREISNWVSQRKLAIIFSTLLFSNWHNRFKLCCILILNLKLLFNLHNWVYLKNRLLRIWHEKIRYKCQN